MHKYSATQLNQLQKFVPAGYNFSSENLVGGGLSLSSS